MGIEHQFFMLFISLSMVPSEAVKFISGPKREVVSIYNENFTTPHFRSPYFVEVYRCVAVTSDDDKLVCGSDNYPEPHNWTEIEIVVPDLSNEVKFYKYIVYNHTSCKCGGTAETERKFRNDTVELVSEDYFISKRHNNPENLRNLCDFCKRPHPRYKSHPNQHDILPKYKYLPYTKCLPGCFAVNSSNTDVQTFLQNGNTPIIVIVTNDIQCEAYDSRKHDNPKKLPLAKQRGCSEVPSNSFDQEPNYELLLYVGSAKMTLVAFLLFLVLFMVFIADFTLYRRKKGLFYALCGCKNGDMDVCKECTQRNLDQIIV